MDDAQILNAPNGVLTYSGTSAVIKEGLEILIPNGDSSYVVKIEADIANTINIANGTYVFVIHSANTAPTLGFWLASDVAKVKTLSQRPTPATGK